jgi:tetratricopeptide (TPR) repeat protein
MELGRFGDARHHLGLLLQETPANPELEDLFGRCEQADKAYDRAATWYARAIEHAPHDPDHYVRLAALYQHHLNQPARADEVLIRLVQANAQSPQALLARLQYRLEAKEVQPEALAQAAQDLDLARQLAPDDAEVIRVGALLARAQGMDDEARRLLHRGLERHPRHVPMYLTLIHLELRDGKARAAKECLLQGLRELPDQGDLLFQWAGVLIQEGEAGKAEELLGRLRQMNYSPPLVELLQARLLAGGGDWGAARRLLESVRPALAGAPEVGHQAAVLLGQCQEHLGSPDQALVAYKEALALDPTSVAARFGMAGALAALGRPDEAAAHYRQVLDGKHAPPETRTVLARVLIARNLRLPVRERNWKEVQEELARASDERPDAAEVLVLQAQVLVLEDAARLGQARRLLAEARDRKPDQVELWVALIDLAELEAKPAEAQRLLDEARQRPRLADRVELRLAGVRHLARQPEAEARPALAEIEQALDRLPPPDRRLVRQELAEAYSRLGARPEAERLWNQLADDAPHNLALRLWLFDLAVRAGRIADVERLVQAIRRLEGPTGTHWRFADASRLVQRALPDSTPEPDRQRLFAQAAGRLDEIARERPGWFRVPALRGQIEEWRKHPDKAAEHYRAAVRLGDRRPAIVQRLVQLLLEQHRFAEADQAVRNLLGEEQTLLSAGLGKYGTLALLRGQDAEGALRLALRSVPPDSKDHLDHLWLGQVLLLLGKEARARGDAPQSTAAFKQAEAALRRARHLAEDRPEPWVALVQLAMATDHKEQAEALMEEARTRLPADRAARALASCHEVLGQPERAEQQYLAALASPPTEPALFAEVVRFYLRNARPAKAEPVLRRMLDAPSGVSAGEVAWARRTLAVLLADGLEHRQFQEAMALLEQNARDGADPEADQHVKARVLAGRNRHRKEAIRLFEELAWKAPLSPDEQFVLAQLYEADGNWHKAQLQLATLLGSPEGKHPTYQAHYARRVLQRGDLAAAADWIARLEKSEPQAVRTVELKARLLQAQRQDLEAVSAVKQHLRDKPADLGPAAAVLDRLAQEPGARAVYGTEAEALYRRYVEDNQPGRLLAFAEFLGRQGRVGEALDLCEAALRKGPAAPALAVAVAVLRAGPATAEQQARVLRRLQDALEQSPAATPLRVSLAGLYDLQGRYAEAAAAYRQILQEDPHHVLALNNLAWLLAAQEGKAPEALALIRRALEIAGPSPQLLDTHAVVALANGDSALAIAELQEAVGAAPTATRYVHLAQAYQAAQNRQAARDNLARAQAAGLKIGQLHPFDRASYERLRGELGLR